MKVRNVRMIAAALTVGLFTHAACSGPTGDEPEPTQDNGASCTGKCDGDSDGEFYAQLEGRDEPVAAYLREAATGGGELEGDYASFLEGVSAEMGCDLSSMKTFVILLSNRSNFPRNIVTLCSDSPRDAAKFFLSTQSDDGTLSDIDGRNFKIAVWDDEADRYNLYELVASDEDAPLQVSVEPGKCSNCHATPAALPVLGESFTPIMNELTDPWTLWNAEPDFRSHRFDELLDPGVAEGEVYAEMIAGDRLGSAADFETIMRAAFDRVAKSRLDLRREPASLNSSLRMLQPLFCDETVNYASENHETNQIQSSAIIDASLREMFLEIGGYDWEHDFILDDRHRFADPTEGEARVEVIPVRGAHGVSMDKSLVARRVLSAEQVLRLRALDWQRPVFSQFRCDLFTQGAGRLQFQGFDASAYEDNGDLAPVLFEEIMKLDGEVALAPSGEGSVLSIPRVDEEALAALRAGELDAYEVTFDAFGAQVDDFLDGFAEPGGRAALEVERNRRGCQARATFPAAPQIPDLTCE